MSKRKQLKAKHRPPKSPEKSGRSSRHVPSASGNASKKSQSDGNGHFSLRDEARVTGGKQTYWTVDTKLRTRGVRFVSAGLYSTMQEDEAEAEESEPNTHHRSATSQTEQDKHAPSLSHRKLNPSVPICTPSPEPEPLLPSPVPSSAADQGPLLSVESSTLFFVDIVGEKTPTSLTDRPVIKSPSPASSDSDDEVVFRGRTPNHARVVDDPVLAISGEVVAPGTTRIITPSENAWDDTSVEWVHRSKPGIGWSVPRVKKRATRPQNLLAFRISEEEVGADDEDDLAVDDYLKNVQDHDPKFLQSLSFANRDIDAELGHGDYMHKQFQSLSVGSPKEGKQVYNGGLDLQNKVDELADMEESGSVVTDDEEEDGPDADDLFDSDSEASGEDDTYDEGVESGQDPIAGKIDDETLAILLSKQEEWGIGSDQLLLYDDAVEASVTRAAQKYAKDMPKKSRRVARDFFPSATLLVNVLDQDPYGGFDVMDYERPSLRKKKGKKSLPFDTSDDEFRETREAAWENDRRKKKARRQDREELRLQGLLGSTSVINKYGEGMTIMEIGKAFESFLGSEAEEKSFPPMDKRRRKMIHEIAAEFGLKTKSIGAGNHRYTKVVKTRTTTRWMENKFAARARKINLGFFPRTDATAKGKKVLRVASRSGGANSAGVWYRDGDVVGGAAPEIGIENKGRAMLEKMGWSSGMALGTLDNKGILTPITHIVKNTKTGLG